MIKYFTKHVYEVDIVATYLQLENGIKKGQIKFSKEISTSELLSRLKTSLEVILQPDNVDVEILLKDKISAVIMPQFHLAHYEFWFAFQLMVANPRRIPLILSYHMERWSDKHKFLNLVEFSLSEIFENNKPINCDKNADSIFDWVYESRQKLGYSKKKSVAKKDNPIDVPYIEIQKSHDSKDENQRTILVRDNAIEPIAAIFNTFLFKPSDYKNLLSLLKGNSSNAPIKLNCKCNEFGYLISKMRTTPLYLIVSSVDKLTDWINLNFEFYSEKAGQYQKASISYSRAAVVGSRPPKSNRRKELDKKLETLRNLK